jgi:hypothetical protein
MDESSKVYFSVQYRADAVERELAVGLKGRTTPKCCPFDIIIDEYEAAIEVKTILTSTRRGLGFIQMNARAKALKRAYANANKLTMFTVAVDLRNSQQRLYVRSGIGTFELETMHTMRGPRAIRKFIRVHTSQVESTSPTESIKEPRGNSRTRVDGLGRGHLKCRPVTFE